MALKNEADNYFSSLNPMATRMYADMDETKANYEQLWPSLSLEEQNQILTESIIKPEVSVKYKPGPNSNYIKEYSVKLVLDDNCSYRDEHSAPFSFKTQSQRDLTIFSKPKDSSAKILINKKIPGVPKRLPNVAESKKMSTSEVPTKAINSSSGNSLPKTGLDFLDNW